MALIGHAELLLLCDSLLVCSLVLEAFELLLLKKLGSVEVEDANQGMIIVVDANQGIDYTLHCPPSLPTVGAVYGTSDQ